MMMIMMFQMFQIKKKWNKTISAFSLNFCPFFSSFFLSLASSSSSFSYIESVFGFNIPLSLSLSWLLVLFHPFLSLSFFLFSSSFSNMQKKWDAKYIYLVVVKLIDKMCLCLCRQQNIYFCCCCWQINTKKKICLCVCVCLYVCLYRRWIWMLNNTKSEKEKINEYIIMMIIINEWTNSDLLAIAGWQINNNEKKTWSQIAISFLSVYT